MGGLRLEEGETETGNEGGGIQKDRKGNGEGRQGVRETLPTRETGEGVEMKGTGDGELGRDVTHLVFNGAGLWGRGLGEDCGETWSLES